MSYFKGAAAGLCGLAVAAAGSFATYQFLEEGFGIGGLMFGKKNASDVGRRVNATQLQAMMGSDSDAIDLNNPSDPEQKGPTATSAVEEESNSEEQGNGKNKRSASRKGRGGRNRTRKKTKESGKGGEKVSVGTDENETNKTIIVAEKDAVEENKPKEDPTDGKAGNPGLDSVKEVASASDKTDSQQSPGPLDNGDNRTPSPVSKEQGTSVATSSSIAAPQTKPVASKAPAKPVPPKPQVPKQAAKPKPAPRPPQRSYSSGMGWWGLTPTLPFMFLAVSQYAGY